MSEIPPTPIQSLTPELRDALIQRSETVLSYLVKTNSVSSYWRESSLLSEFRNSLTFDLERISSENSNELLGKFVSQVPLSTYPDYLPFVSRFFEPNPTTASLKDILAPGVPYFIAHSSATSGKQPKHFPKYRHPDEVSHSTRSVMIRADPKPQNGGTNCIVYSLGYRQLIEPHDEDGELGKKIPVCLMSAGVVRMEKGMDVEKDLFFKTLRAPNATSPIAVSFIPYYRTFILMHVLFALCDPSLEIIYTVFSTIFLDFTRLLEEQWDMLVDTVETGIIPDLEGIEDVKSFLQKQIKPNPTRAAELRAVGRATAEPGWIKKIWPNLEKVVTICSGTFSSLVPKIRHYIGPLPIIYNFGFTCSEGFLAVNYDAQELNLFKVVGSDDIMEFLDVDASEVSSSLVQAWDVKPGKKYEVILTTRDGFWRYRLGDVIEVAGFDPRDGQPLIRYSERRNVVIRVANEMVTENELQEAIHSTVDTLGQVLEFCVAADDRTTPNAYGFLVELRDEPGLACKGALEQIQESLKQNVNYLKESAAGKIAPPTIRILRSGAFRKYREWKIATTSCGSGQVKVPVVVNDVETRGWLTAMTVSEVTANGLLIH